MDEINGIPFMWNQQSDNQLLGSLFPQGNGNSQPNNTNDNFPNYKWQHLKLSLKEIQNNFFGNITPLTVSNVTILQEKDTNVDFNLKEFDVYTETNGKEGYQKDEDIYLYKVKIFVSTKGEKIQQAYFESQPESNEAAFFIEDNTGDLSTAKLYAKFGSAVQKQVLLGLSGDGYTKSYLKKFSGIDDAIIKDLIQKGSTELTISATRKIVTSLCHVMSFINFPVFIVGKVCDVFGNFIIDNLSVPETLWDSNNPEYFLKKENVINALTINPKLADNVISRFSQTSAGKLYIAMAPDSFYKITGTVQRAITEFITNYNKFVKTTLEGIYSSLGDAIDKSILSEQFALLCGVWNGLVDFVGGIFLFLGFLGQNNYNLYSDIDACLERFDSFCEILTTDFWSRLWEAVKASYKSLTDFIKKSGSDDFNPDKVAYIAGYAISFIGTFFIPIADFAKPAEIAAKLKKAFVPIDLLESVSKVGKFAKNTATALIETLDSIIAFIAKNKQELITFFEDIWKKIADWMLKNKTSFKYVDEIEEWLITYINILKQSKTYRKSIESIKSLKRPLGRWLVLEQEAAIHLYTKSYYILFNRALRGLNGIRMTREFKAMQKILDDALDKLPKFEGNKNLMRSTWFEENDIKKLFKEGGDFIDNGFFSTTYSEEALHRWMITNPSDNVLFKVEGKNGKLIEASSNIKDEAEVLFKSGTVFKVESVREIDHPIHKFQNIIQIILKEK